MVVTMAKQKRQVKDPDLVLAEQLDHKIRNTAKGAGTNRVNIGDVWNPRENWTPGKRVLDERMGLLECRHCGAEVFVTEIADGSWVKVERCDDGKKERHTCKGRR